ncbi:MAG TPA: PDZ domain-containing protein [Sphingomicrobium sp.]|nr:PDZ domain-containing protein [Sphingomicrobium sp.]
MALKSALAILIACAILFAMIAVAVRQVRVEAPASHDARALLKLDSALGATLEPLDATSARILGGGSEKDDMVVTSLASGGRASAAGIRVGDVVEAIDGKDASDVDQALAALGPAPTRVVINRHGNRAIVELPGNPDASRG